jgi:hypothetical protein
MSGSCVIPLLRDFDVKEMKSQTLKLRRDDSMEKETFDVKKSDRTTIEILFNTVLWFHTMSSRMEFTGSMMYSYFDKCLLDNALEEWRLVTPHEDDQTVENFKFSMEEWFNTLLPDNSFLAQKEWMMNTMKQPFVMKVKDFGNWLRTLNCFLTLMHHDDDKDVVFTDTDLKALLLKLMPLSWQNAYLLKGTRVSDDFQQRLSYFVQFQSITDNHTGLKVYSASQGLDSGKQHKYICTNHGQSEHFPSYQSGRNNTDQIPWKNTGIQGPFVGFWGPCPVHPMSSHTWGDCFNSPKNKASECQNRNLHSMEIHSGCGYHYSTRG